MLYLKCLIMCRIVEDDDKFSSRLSFIVIILFNFILIIKDDLSDLSRCVGAG